MKYCFFFLVFSFFYSSLPSQHPFPESIFFSNKLEPYRRHLDSIAKKINANKLYAEYQNKIISGDTAVIYLTPLDRDYYWQKEAEILDKNGLWRPFPQAKYSYQKFLEMDSMNAMFSEFEFDFENRGELLFLKKQYDLAINDSVRVLQLLKYIRAVDEAIPDTSIWKFSRSYILSKYVRKIESLFKTQKNSFNKAGLLIKYAETLEFIDSYELNMYIFYVYVEAETLLLSPYNKNIDWDHLDNDFRNYVIKNNIGTKLKDVYDGIARSLTIKPILNISNELYPIVRKIRSYLEKLREVLVIVNNQSGNYSAELQLVEEAILGNHTSSASLLSRKVKYSYAEFQDRVYILEKYISVVLSSAKPSPSKRISVSIYLSLGSFFETVNDYKYALKAYYMALGIAINSNNYFEAETLETLYFLITGVYKKQHHEKAFTNIEKDEIKRLLNLYRLTNDPARLQKNEHDLIYHTICVVNESRFLYLKGNIDLAKKSLLNKKRALLKDPSIWEEDPAIIGLIYSELLENNWLEVSTEMSELERSADSVMLALHPVEKNMSSRFNDNEDFIQGLEMMTSIETNSRWRYRDRILEDEIAKNLKALVLLKKEIDLLNSGIKGLRLYADSLNSSNNLLDSQNQKLKIDSNILSSIITKQKSDIHDLDNQKKELERKIKNRSLLGGTAIVLSIIISLFILYQKGIQIRKLTQSKKDLSKEVFVLTEQKNSLTADTANLKSQLQANKEAYESELKYQNERVLREMILKHEIVGVTKNLLPTFQNTMAVILNNPRETEKELNRFNKKLEVLDSFASIYYLTLNNEDYNSIDIEVKLAKHYIEFWNLSNSNVLFHDLQTHKNTEIVVPLHIVNNFAKNAIEHGEIRSAQLNVTILDEREGEDYVLKIVDDGVGVGEGFSFENLNPESTGLRNMATQIDYFNRSNRHNYFLEFNTNSIVDRRLIDGKNGTIVTLKIIEKYDYQ